jgi:hypothetical protein
MLSVGDFLFFSGWVIMAIPFVVGIGRGAVAIYRNVDIDTFKDGAVLIGFTVALPCWVIGGIVLFIGDGIR